MKILENLDTVGIWGVTVTLGYLLTGLINQIGLEGATVNYSIILMWLILMIVPGHYSLQEYREDGNWKNLNVIWAVIILIGVLANITGQMSLTGNLLRYSYYQKWFLLPGLLFAYTAYRMDGFSKNIYAVATVLNLAVAFMLSSSPLLQSYAFLVAAAIQGVPMLVDWHHFNM